MRARRSALASRSVVYESLHTRLGASLVDNALLRRGSVRVRGTTKRLVFKSCVFNLSMPIFAPLA